MTRRLISLLALAALVLTACGGDDTTASADADRTVVVEMRDHQYSPSSIDITKGETVRFVFRNKGKVDHDAFIGDAKAQAEHEKEMSEAMPGMHHADGGDNAITVAPGKQGELAHTFAEVGTFLIGCHETGHYASGMRVTLTVS